MDVSEAVLLALDMLGVFFFALSGNLLAARKNFDITGGLTLGLMAGLGGGMVRDMLLGVKPMSLDKPMYLIPPVVAAIAVYLVGHHSQKARLFIVLFDAVGLAVFCTSGAVRALDHDANVVTAILLGVITAVGGGLLRDVVANEEPAVFYATDLYVIPAAFGAGLATLAASLDAWNAWTGIAIATFVFTFRMAAWFLQWRVPQAVRGWRFRDIAPRRSTPRGEAFRSPAEGFGEDEVGEVEPGDGVTARPG